MFLNFAITTWRCEQDRKEANEREEFKNKLNSRESGES